MRSEGRNMNFCSSSDVQVCCFGAGREDGLFFKLKRGFQRNDYR